jgi:hypothetical protein
LQVNCPVSYSQKSVDFVQEGPDGLVGPIHITYPLHVIVDHNITKGVLVPIHLHTQILRKNGVDLSVSNVSGGFGTLAW